MASEGLFSGCWTPATLRTFQVPLRASQLKVKAFYTRVGALADLKISKACRNIYRRIFSGGVIAWHGRNDLRDTTGLPFAKLTRIDRNVRAMLNTYRLTGAVSFRRGEGVGALLVTDQEAGAALGHAQLDVVHELPASQRALLSGAAFLE